MAEPDDFSMDRPELPARPPSQKRVLAIGFAVIALIGVLDYYTGPQVSSSLFYLLPILFITHHTNRKAGLWAALFATVLWFSTDILPDNHFKGIAIPCWNAVMRLGVFLIASSLVSSMKRLSNTLELRVDERTWQLRRETDERIKLEERILEISEREQARMGQDLHDGLCQHLVGTAFSANILQKKMADKGLPEASELQNIANLIDESITHARQLAQGLYPVRIEDLGLVIALEELATSSEGLYRVPCRFTLTGDAPNINQSTAVHLYRIAQEAVTNAMKHARAAHVWIRLKSHSNALQMRVEDDGIGIVDGTATGNGLGLKIMEFRARMIDGDLHIKRRVSGGTTVMCTATVPQDKP